MAANMLFDIVGTIIKHNGLETPYRIGNSSGEVFAEGEDFDGITLTIAVESQDEAEAILAILHEATRK